MYKNVGSTAMEHNFLRHQPQNVHTSAIITALKMETQSGLKPAGISIQTVFSLVCCSIVTF